MPKLLTLLKNGENKMDNKRILKTVIFYGGLWGMTEATLGHFLHIFPCGISGMIMFPIAFYFMFNSFQKSGKTRAIFYTALVAASVKLFDLFIPLKTISSTLNPFSAIILESLIVFGFVKVLRIEKKFVYRKAAVMGILALTLLTLMQALIFQPNLGLYKYPLDKLIMYICLNGLSCGIFIGAYLSKKEQIERYFEKSYIFNGLKTIIHKPVFAIIIVCFAIFFEIGNSLWF